MRRVTWRATLLAVGFAALAAAPSTASASPVRDAGATSRVAGRAKVQWVKVDVPDRGDSAHLQKVLKKALGEASRRADFGKAKSVALTARVIEMKAEERGDVLRITCTVMGRVVGGAGARSRISYGGSPDQREELEKEVLTQVARGLVGRLAQIVRTRARE